MKALLYPKSIAVFGVSEARDNFGKSIVKNLIDFQYTGEIYPIGKEPGSVYHLPIYTSISDVEADVEAAIFLVPAKAIPTMLEECGEKGIRRVIISSGGFSEFSDGRRDLEDEIVSIAEKYGIRFIGPNCIGIINQDNGLCLPFVRMAHFPNGPVALFTQSGGVGLGVINQFTGHNLGINKYISLGNKLNVGEPELLSFLETDESVKVACMYLEEIDQGRELMSAVRGMTKPVVIYKANTTVEGARMAASHTAAVANDDKVVDAALRQAGVIRVTDMLELPTACKVFGLPPMKGNRVAVITPTGGHAVICADECDRLGFELPQFPEKFIKDVEKHVRAGVIKLKNPLDFGDMFDYDMLGTMITRTLQEESFDALVLSYIVISSFPKTMFINVFPVLENMLKTYGKPIILCLTGNPSDIHDIRQKTAFPIFESPDQAVRALAMLRDHTAHAALRAEKPELPEIDAAAVDAVIDRALAAGRKELTSEAMEILKLCGVSSAPEALCADAKEAARAAAEMGFPVALKIASPDILHKTEAGGVALGLDSEEAVMAAFEKVTASAKKHSAGARILGCVVQKMVAGAREMLLGVNYNEQFGHAIVFGMGGVYVEAIQDVSMKIAPLTRSDAAGMLTEFRAAKMLGDFRGMGAADSEAIIEIILKISSLVTACPRIREFDINPLMVPAAGRGIFAVDARAVVG